MALTKAWMLSRIRIVYFRQFSCHWYQLCWCWLDSLPARTRLKKCFVSLFFLCKLFFETNSFLVWGSFHVATCLKYKQKQNKNTHHDESDDDDDEEKLNSKFISKIRLIVGGLMLPTIAVGLDRLVFGTFGLKCSSLLRTTLVINTKTFINIFWNKLLYIYSK